MIANVAENFGLGPYAAWQELGGGVLSRGRRRRLTLDVTEALYARRLVREANTEHGKDGWTEDDVAFHKELRRLAGFVQPPMGGPGAQSKDEG